MGVKLVCRIDIREVLCRGETMYTIIRVSDDYEIVVVEQKDDNEGESKLFVHWPLRFDEHTSDDRVNAADSGDVEPMFAEVDERFVMVSCFSPISDMMGFGPLPDASFSTLEEVWLHERGYDLLHIESTLNLFQERLPIVSGEKEVKFKGHVRMLAQAWLDIVERIKDRKEVKACLKQKMQTLSSTDESSLEWQR